MNRRTIVRLSRPAERDGLQPTIVSSNLLKQNCCTIIIAVFLLLCLGSFALPQGKGHGVEVRITSPKIVTVEPGRIVTASFLVKNNTDKEEEFFESLKLPAACLMVPRKPS